MSYPTFDQLLPVLTASAQRWTPDFAVDAENEETIRYALAWACAHPRFTGDPGKGLLLMGHKGTGKTLLMRSLGAVLDPSIRFTVSNTRKVTSAYNCDGDEGLRQFLRSQHMLFDDLGDERMGQHYGDKVEAMSLVIQERYELFVDQGIMSHFTTNLTGKEIAERYGDRVYSRLLHMVNSIRVGSAENATDRRVTAKAPERNHAVTEERVIASKEVADEGFRRVREAISLASKELSAKKPAMHIVPASQEEDALAFGQRIVTKTDAELKTLRDDLERSDTYGSSKKFIELIDREFEEREADDKAQMASAQ